MLFEEKIVNSCNNKFTRKGVDVKAAGTFKYRCPWP